MVDLDQGSRGVVKRPGSGPMVIEVINLAWQIRRWYVGGNDPSKISDPGWGNDVPGELRSHTTGSGVEDGDLASVCSQELTEIAAQESFSWNRGEQPGIP